MKIMIACLAALIALNVFQFMRITSLQSQNSRIISEVEWLKIAQDTDRKNAEAKIAALKMNVQASETQAVRLRDPMPGTTSTFILRDVVEPGLIEVNAPEPNAVKLLDARVVLERANQYTEPELRQMHRRLDFGLYHDPKAPPEEQTRDNF